MLGMGLAALDQTVVSVALPRISAELGGIDHLTWIVTSYLLASTVAAPIYGKLGDMYGMKRLFQVAIVIFLIGSVLSGLARSMTGLIAFRAVQGLGAGGLMVLAMAVIGQIVPSRERGRYVGLFGGVFALSSVVGPLLGGFLVETLSWRWIFYVNLPLGAAALVMVALYLHVPAGEPRSHRVDWLGAALMTVGTTALILVTSWGGREHPWTSPLIIALIVVGVLALVGFVLQERRAEEPLIPTSLFHSRVFSVVVSLGFFIGLALFGAITFIPLYLQLVDGASPTESGLLMLPLMVGLLSMSIVSGRIISRVGRYRIFPMLGTALTCVGMLLLSTLSTDTSSTLSSLYMLVVGLGLGLVMQVLVIVAQNAAPTEDVGVATSTVTFLRSIGGSIGIAVLGAVFAHRLADEIADRFGPGGGGRLVEASPEQIARLPASTREAFLSAFADSLHTVFLYAAGLVAVAFVISLFLRDIPLRDARSEAETVGEELGMPAPDDRAGTGIANDRPSPRPS